MLFYYTIRNVSNTLYALDINVKVLCFTAKNMIYFEDVKNSHCPGGSLLTTQRTAQDRLRRSPLNIEEAFNLANSESCTIVVQKVLNGSVRLAWCRIHRHLARLLFLLWGCWSLVLFGHFRNFLKQSLLFLSRNRKSFSLRETIVAAEVMRNKQNGMPLFCEENLIENKYYLANIVRVKKL